MAPGGFGQRAKANAAAAAAVKAEQSATTNIPLLQANSMGRLENAMAWIPSSTLFSQFAVDAVRLPAFGWTKMGMGDKVAAVAIHWWPTIRQRHDPFGYCPLLYLANAFLWLQSLVAKAMATSRSGDNEKGSGSLAVNIEPDSYSEPEQPPLPLHQERPRRQSRSSPSGGNSPARRMSALSSALEESSRHIAKMSHCSANGQFVLFCTHLLFGCLSWHSFGFPPPPNIPLLLWVTNLQNAVFAN